ncbi:MAG: alanine racemase [Planctomycetota bacterium]|nr:alanine racemase [Planctomycetota bacterium]
MTAPFAGCSPGRYLGDDGRSAPTSTPHLVIDLPTVRDNVARVLEAIGGPDRWRPHLKTSKLSEVWTLLREQGLNRFKCATVLELSQLLSIAPEADCVLAHHPDEAACGVLGALAHAHPRARIACLVEQPADLDRIPGEVGLFVDVDPGMHRSGLESGRREPIVELVRQAGSRCRGIHFYDGHLRDGNEASRRQRAHAGYDLLLELDAATGGRGELVTSGTPSFLHALAHRGLAGTGRHSVSPGTVVLHDGMSERLPEIARLGLVPAAAVVATVVSHPGATLATANAGSKSISADVPAPCCTVLGHPGAIPLGASEEHLPIEFPGAGTRPARGERVVLVPEHVCPTVNLARSILLQDQGARRVVPNPAGGHPSPIGSDAAASG